MRDSVLAAFPAFTTPFEGRLPYMYLDALGLVTTGVGNLIDPIAAALTLPWTNADGVAATEEEIISEWNTVKGLTGLDQKGGTAYASHTQLRLSNEAIDNLVQSKLQANEAELKKYFPDWENFTANVQLGILSMAWAMGPGFPTTFPTFTKAVNDGDWATATAQSQMKPTPGIGPRNAADKYLFENATANDPDDVDAAGAVEAAGLNATGLPSAVAVLKLDPSPTKPAGGGGGGAPSSTPATASGGSRLAGLTLLAIVIAGGWISYSLLRGT